MPLLQSFQKSLVQTGCIPPSSRVLVAVSGGADSVALLSLLNSLSEDMALHIEAAHLDHSLRDESQEDALFVETLCTSLKIPLTMERHDVGGLAREMKGNLEEVARDVRLDFLGRVARAGNCQLIALGHHADDQAETFLLRLLRGSGSTGLAAMRLVEGNIVRPLLSFSRTELTAYLQSKDLSWREDRSNLDQSFTRNRIRHQLLPLMESFNPNISRKLVVLCDQLRQDDDFWVALAAQELARCGHRQENGYALSRQSLLELAPALVSRVVRAALGEVRGNLRGLSAGHIGDVLSLLSRGPSQGELNLPGAWVARRYETLLLQKKPPERVKAFRLLVNGPGAYPLPDGRMLTVSLTDQASGEGDNSVEFLAHSLSFPLLLRSCQPGDRFRPSGMTGSKKIQDFFVDSKLSLETRQNSLLLLSADEVIWLVGMRRAEGCRVVPGKPVLKVVVEG